MRELKFRIWIKDESRFYDESDDESYLIVPNGNVICESGTYEEDGMLFKDTTNQTSNVIVEQYTGLKDKNGREIYENDIVKYTAEIANNKGSTYRVEYYNEWGMYDLEPLEDNVDTGGFNENLLETYYEVIGNIHENPELLEELE